MLSRRGIHDFESKHGRNIGLRREFNAQLRGGGGEVKPHPSLTDRLQVKAASFGSGLFTNEIIEHLSGGATRQEARLWRLLVEKGAIEYVDTPMFRGISIHPKHVSRATIGHWWNPNMDGCPNYASRFGDGDGTCVVGTSDRRLVFLRFKQVFECGPVGYAEHDDGTWARWAISNPTLRREFRAFRHMPFLKEVRRLEMFADDNVASDAFRVHGGSLQLNGITLDGLSSLCDGDPIFVGDRNNEYWILNPRESFTVIRKKRFREELVNPNIMMSDDEYETDEDYDDSGSDSGSDSSGSDSSDSDE